MYKFYYKTYLFICCKTRWVSQSSASGYSVQSINFYVLLYPLNSRSHHFYSEAHLNYYTKINFIKVFSVIYEFDFLLSSKEEVIATCFRLIDFPQHFSRFLPLYFLFNHADCHFIAFWLINKLQRETKQEFKRLFFFFLNKFKSTWLVTARQTLKLYSANKRKCHQKSCCFFPTRTIKTSFYWSEVNSWIIHLVT